MDLCGTTTIDDYCRLKTANTQRAVRAVLSQWFDFLQNQPPTPPLALRFIAALNDRGLSDNTIRHRYRILRAYHEFLVAMELLDRNPFLAVKHTISWRQARPVRPTKFIEFSNVAKLLSKDDEMYTTKEYNRDKAMLTLFFSAGLRRCELWMLNVGDIVISEANGGHTLGIITLHHTKAGKPQERHLASQYCHSVVKLITQRNLDGASNDSPLFCFYYKDGRAGGRVSQSTIYRIYRESVGAAPHSARATFATKLKSQGIEDRMVAEALGHGSIKQVQVYDKRAGQERNAGSKIFY